LTSKINAISKRDYNQKLNINSNDEMGNLAGSFNVMVQRLKEYEETNLDQILFEKKRMEAIVKNLEDGVLILDENKKIILTNNSLLNLASLKEEDTINKFAPDIAVTNNLIKTMIQKLITKEEAGQDDEIKPIKIIFSGKENYYSIEHIEVDLKSSVYKGASLVGYIILLKNVTLFQERDTAKTNLIATVSHELKTPLSSINLSLKLLEDRRIGSVNDEQKGLINSIRQQSFRLSKVVNELLDFSQAETGNIKLRITEIRPEDIVELAVIALMMLLSEKNIQLETELTDPLPSIKADLEKTVWVLVNIINNAIRYSPLGGTITLKAVEDNRFIKFIVKDQGPGISEEDCEKIFEKFVQVGKRTSKGSGLGLAIAKEFVLAQGGKIWVESKPGEGSTFLFTIPVAKF
jgi:signal transduction histidine kinase